MTTPLPGPRIDRRHLLRGVGAAVALPMLECMTKPRPRREGGDPPRRAVFLYVPNGVHTLAWQIERAGADYELTAPMASLVAHRDVLTPISGLHHPAGIGKAHECEKIWLTGAEMDPRVQPFRNSISVDQRMAEVVGAETRHPSLALSMSDGTLSWSRDGVPLPATARPGDLFERLFRPSADTGEARRALRRRGGVLDAVLDDARRLRARVGRGDAARLDEYLAALREVEERTRRADRWLDVPLPEIDDVAAERITRRLPDEAVAERTRTMIDLVVLALRSDVTRVVTLKLGSETRTPAPESLGVRQGRHELSHHNGDPTKVAALTRWDAFLTEQLAYLLDRLREPDDGAEPLIDRTMVLFGSGMSYGHSHGNANLPLLLAGGGALGLRHGRHVDYNLPHIGGYDLDDPKAHYQLCVRPVDPDARMCDLLLTMLHRMGVRDDSFGDSRGVISELVP